MDKSAFKHVVIIASFTGSLVQDLTHKDHLHNQAPPYLYPQYHSHPLSTTYATPSPQTHKQHIHD